MVEIIKDFLDLAALFINNIFEWKIEWDVGQHIEIGKLTVAFIFIVCTLYMIFDSMGLLDKEE